MKLTLNKDVVQTAISAAFTDAGNAERLEMALKENWRYIPQIKRWLRWTGKRWQEQEEDAVFTAAAEAYRRMIDAVYELPKAADKAERERRERIINWLEKSENAGKIKAALVFLRDLLKDDYGEYDKAPFLLNCQNGTLNLETGILQGHDKNDKLTKICLCDYEELAQSTKWLETVRQILRDEPIRNYMQRFIGYCLTASTQEEKFLIAYGPGGCGKGTFFETIAAVLNDYRTTIPIDVLLANGIADSGNGPTPELAKLPGKRYVLSAESGKNRRLDEAKVKLLTGGDTVTARRLHAEPFDFKPSFKLVMQTNFLPSVTDSLDKGIQRRLVIIPFTAKLETNHKLKAELLKPENLKACLSWAVAGCRIWMNAGLGEVPEAAKAAAAAFYSENDLLQQWLEENTEQGTGAFLLVSKGLQDFNAWISVGGNNARYGRRTFSDAMERHGYLKSRTERGTGYAGLCLKWKN